MNTQPSGNAAADLAVNLIQRITEQFTFHHDSLKLWVEPMGRVQIVYLQTHKADMPRVIGKQGSHRLALATIVSAIGQRYSTDLRFENVEPESGTVQRYGAFAPSTKWESGPVVQLLKDVCATVFVYPVEVQLFDASRSPTSTLQVIVDDSESKAPTVKLSEAIKVLWNAIGKANGRILVVDVISKSEHAKLNSGVVAKA